METRAISGFLGSGCDRRTWACSGRLDIGALAGGLYGWHGGYWGPHVGFYGGVNYGFGFGGVGFVGGEWRGGVFAYNSAVANFGSVHVTNVYENRTDRYAKHHCELTTMSASTAKAVLRRVPRAGELQAEHEQHSKPRRNQTQHMNFAARTARNSPSVNHGAPGTPAASNPKAYHEVAQQHSQSQPISAADRTAGKNYNPNTREANQDQRIANGQRSGEMTSGEAARAEGTQSKIDSQVHNDRAANGGKLTGQESSRLTASKMVQAARSTTRSTTTKRSSPTPSTTGKPTSSSAPPTAYAVVK